MTRTSARGRAVATETREIEASTQRAVTAREQQSGRRMNAVEAMANRCNVTESELRQALRDTVFKECRSEAQFIALAIVANEYQLNPLLKEIYAFPTGGGVTPMVSVDGWISLMNRHPQFDSIEFENIEDAQGNIEAIEAIIYRKDKERPTKIMEYMEECAGNTKPWTKSPRRMLRHRALIQCARVAFGFSGLAMPDDDFIEGTYEAVHSVPSLPSNDSFSPDDGPVTTIDQPDPAQTRTTPAPSSSSAPAAETTIKPDPAQNEEQSEQDKECDLLIADFEAAQDSNELGITRNAWLDKQERDYFDEDQDADIQDAFNVACERLGIDPNTGQLLNPPAQDTATPSPSPTPTPAAASAEPAPDYLAKVRVIRDKLAKAKTVRAVDTMDMNEWCGPLREQVQAADPRLATSVDNDVVARKRELQAPKEN